MLEIPALRTAERAWLLDGPLAAFVAAYVGRLKEGRYAPGTVRRCLGALAHFAHWMALCRLPAGRLDESRVDQFLHDHLPRCGCPEFALRHPREAHAALMPPAGDPAPAGRHRRAADACRPGGRRVASL